MTHHIPHDRLTAYANMDPLMLDDPETRASAAMDLPDMALEIIALRAAMKALCNQSDTAPFPYTHGCAMPVTSPPVMAVQSA